MRTRGMSPATIRRHLAALVETGFIIRRDSPNGKRYARRGETGEIEHAFGFDLSPLALRSDEIEAHALEARDLARAIQRVRSEITIHLRDISKTIDAGLNEERSGDWDIYADELAALSGRVSRHLPLAALQARCDGLARLRANVERAYLESLTDKEMSASDSSFEHHIQNSNTDHHFERAQENGQKPTAAGTTENTSPGSRVAMTRMRKRLEDARRTRGQGAAGSSDVWPGRETKPAPMPLEAVLNACPQIRDYARNGIGDWHDLVQTAGLVRSMLGVSPDAWERARETMGEINASITIAAILERVDEIRSPWRLSASTDRPRRDRPVFGASGDQSPQRRRSCVISYLAIALTSRHRRVGLFHAHSQRRWRQGKPPRRRYRRAGPSVRLEFVQEFARFDPDLRAVPWCCW